MELSIISTILSLFLKWVVVQGFNEGLTVRILGGKGANINDFPYQVSLVYSGSPECGGVLISDSFVLTAAHCISDNLTNVRAGSSCNDVGGQLFEIEEIFIHPMFNVEAWLDYDFAILRLKRSSNHPEVFAFAKLPGNFEEPLPEEIAVVSGWGLTYDSSPYQKRLQSVDIPVINDATCKDIFAPIYITNQMFCAGYEDGGRGSCSGDSGGPLISKRDKTLIGIVSWGDAKCSKDGGTGVYAKVSSVRSWIKNITNI